MGQRKIAIVVIGEVFLWLEPDDVDARFDAMPSGKSRAVNFSTDGRQLAHLLKTSPQFWMRLQADWDLHEAMQRAARKAS